MSTARHLIALLRTHVQGDEHEFLSVAMELAAREARLGHAKVAGQIRDLVDQARTRASLTEKRPGSVVVLQPKGKIANPEMAKLKPLLDPSWTPTDREETSASSQVVVN